MSLALILSSKDMETQVILNVCKTSKLSSSLITCDQALFSPCLPKTSVEGLPDGRLKV